MNYIRRRQLLYGSVWGGAAFAAVVATTWFVIPEGSIETSLDRWELISWFVLGAHFVPISGYQALGFEGLGSSVYMLDAYPEYRYLYPAPAIALAFASFLSIDSIGHTTRPRNLLENGLAPIPAYVVLLVGTVVISDAQPGFTIFFVIGFGLLAALYLGSRVLGGVVQGMGIFAIASLGTVMLVGLAVLFGGFILIHLFWRAAVLVSAGCLTGAGLLYIVRTRT